MITAAALFLFIVIFERRMPDTLTSLREASRILPGFDPGNVVKFEIRGLESTPRLTLRREKPGAGWFIIQPEKYPASEYSVGVFILSLADLPKLSYVADKGDKTTGDYGLDKGTIEIHLEDNSGKEWDLTIGSPTTAGNGVYLKIGDLEDIYVTDGTLLARLPEKVNEWKRRIVFHESMLGFDSVEVTYGELTYELSRNTQGGWKLTKPIEARASQALAVALDQTLRELRIREFVEAPSSATALEFGLDNPSGTLSLKKGGIELARLLMGDLKEDDTDPVAPANLSINPDSPDAALVQSRYAKLSDQQDVFLIPETLAELVLAPYTRFRDPLVVGLQPGQVNRLEVRGSEFFVIEQMKDSTNWVYEARPEYPLDPELVRETLATLSAMRVNRFHDLPNDLKPFGLAPPWRQIILKTKSAAGVSEAESEANGSNSGEESKVIAQLDFGYNELQEAFVKRADETTVYQINPGILYRLPKGPFQLRDRKLWDFDSLSIESISVSQGNKALNLVKNEQKQWGLAPGSSGIINTFAIEEALYKISQAKAIAWTDQGIDKLQAYQIGEGAFTISWKKGNGEASKEWILKFGGISPTTQNPYAATLIDNKWTIFEFSGEVYGELLYAFGNPLKSP